MSVLQKRLRTTQVQSGLLRSNFCETSESLFITSGYVYTSAEEAAESFNGIKDRYIYSRFKNPTVRIFETRLAEVEGAADSRATASGMAAVYATLACDLMVGDRIIASHALFSSCTYILTEILPRFGIQIAFVTGTHLEQWEEALAKPAKIVFLETPSNPTLEIIDLQTICQLAHAAGAQVVVDNVFASPVLQRPLQLGADVVVYSATKYLDGHGRCLGGAILTNDQQWLDNKLTAFLRHTGPILSPFNAWMLLKSLETLDLRVKHHCDNAAQIASFLESRTEIREVLYPGLTSHPQYALATHQMSGGGGVLSFKIGEKCETVYRLLNNLHLISISNNLGDAKSLITHPATTTHQRLSERERSQQGITENLVRLSVGLEDAQDLIDDLSQAIEQL